jgi:putative sigma-54 modulation protein
MLFTISGRHIEIGDSVKAYAKEKCEKLPRHFDSVSAVQVIVEGKEGNDHSVEIIASIEHSSDSVVTEVGDDLYACIDVAVDKIERQLRRKKEKQRNNKHIGNSNNIDHLDQL